MTNGNDDSGRGIPTARNVDHIGLTVSDLDEGIEFFTEVLGCDFIYRAGPFEDQESDWMQTHLGVDPRAQLELAMVRCGPVTNIELLEYRLPEGADRVIENSDVNAPHLAFHVEDMEQAIEYLDSVPEVEVLDGPAVVGEDESSGGLEYVYASAPWGLQLELVQWSSGMPYEQETNVRPYGPAPSWQYRPENEDRSSEPASENDKR